MNIGAFSFAAGFSTGVGGGRHQADAPLKCFSSTKLVCRRYLQQTSLFGVTNPEVKLLYPIVPLSGIRMGIFGRGVRINRTRPSARQIPGRYQAQQTSCNAPVTVLGQSPTAICGIQRLKSTRAVANRVLDLGGNLCAGLVGVLTLVEGVLTVGLHGAQNRVAAEATFPAGAVSNSPGSSPYSTASKPSGRPPMRRKENSRLRCSRRYRSAASAQVQVRGVIAVAPGPAAPRRCRERRRARPRTGPSPSA